MNNKPIIPPIGFGTWRLAGSEAQMAVTSATQCGYRLIDTAAAYGNEVSLRKALRECGISRDELFISNKLWNTKRGYDDAILACKQSLKRMGLDSFDLYLVHWPASPALYPDWETVNAECWRAMETILNTGLAKNIGVCNYLPHHLDELKKTATIMPAVNQIELHPGFLHTEVLNYCNQQSILVEAWSPLGEGSLLFHPTILQIASGHEKSPAQVCLRWCIQHGAVPLPKSVQPQRITQNFAVFDFALTSAEMEQLDAMPFSGGPGFDPDTITIYG